SADHEREAQKAEEELQKVLEEASKKAVEAERGAPGAALISYPDAIWWSVETATTVGYGDRYPVTEEGRKVAEQVMKAGIEVFALVTAALATDFVRREEERRGH
uniref:water soluble analogue of potassium channel, KcsA n=1 Tax=Escherichia coli TaxID=562 RepID=UPI00018408B1|nr:Chain A, water soluble analogue of potassium channel, KcsA [unidentified]2K1E_B Chain B, water soluble analogue of potassium channel, KcsA [unidentified]2K1E_C Chain C, water soluble analogue of potassium channel, KcsA [unidentified]2K1E_D Chain D, water soluble analogue of potassium channel, KcsA [unidentified]2KB1_A Chain A, WSK3 [Escherichia coli]2KB1_B Chain B, WSK3 [Escherichia coli]2KB1_C Chain C, WSK3 [Escherichia coli]2KB1_D Chain D, WSK3 [Escherichia coli]